MRETTGFSHVEFHFQPKPLAVLEFPETIDFSRMEFQFRPSFPAADSG